MRAKLSKIFGISLLEIMLVLAVIATLMLGVTRYYHLTRENLRVTEATTMIKNIADASYKWAEGKANFKDFGDNGISLLVEAKLLPESYADDSANPWHGEILVSSYPKDTGDNFKITMQNILDSSCNDLQAKLAREAATECDGTTFSITFATP